jgi:hypothetical protein
MRNLPERTPFFWSLTLTGTSELAENFRTGARAAAWSDTEIKTAIFDAFRYSDNFDEFTCQLLYSSVLFHCPNTVVRPWLDVKR